jgi:Domain of unknown function (DUF222)
MARERIGAALDAVIAAHAVLRETSSDVVGNDFRVADPPDGAASLPSVRGALCARLRVTPREIVRRFRLAARIRPRRSLTAPPVPPELAALAGAVQAGAVGEDHIRAVRHPVTVIATLAVRPLGTHRGHCRESGYRCEAQHAPDWAAGGRTDADKLFFACGRDHGAASRGEWHTVVTDTGRLGWTHGNGPPQINHAHQPEELLQGDPDPPDEEEDDEN